MLVHVIYYDPRLILHLTHLLLLIVTVLSSLVFDAGVAAWEMKYYYDTTRPFTLINEMFFGSKVPDWRCKPAIQDPYCQTAFTDDKSPHWRPYQLRRNIVPPFPDIPSGHSAFSTSSSVVLRNLLGTNEFNFISEPFKSRFDLTAGFDGDVANGNEDTTLSYATFSEAADEAGISRLYGGIHHMNGNVLGLEMGARVGHKTMAFLRDIFNEPTLGRSPVDDVWNDLIFGTGLNDTLTTKCSPTTPIVEVYGFYGDDGKLYSLYYAWQNDRYRACHHFNISCIAKPPFIIFLSLLQSWNIQEIVDLQVSLVGVIVIPSRLLVRELISKITRRGLTRLKSWATAEISLHRLSTELPRLVLVALQ